MKKDQNKTTTQKTWKDYLKSPDRQTRLKNLDSMRHCGSTFPVYLAEDLLLLDLSIEEKCKILELSASNNNIAFEHFLTSYLFEWPQDLAALAVRIWADKTDHILWFRLVSSSTTNILPQRVLYTLIDVAHAAGGSLLIERVANIDGLQNFSAAFHGLLLHRAVQWSTYLPTLAALSQRIIREINTQYHPEHKAINSAIAYLLRFHRDQVDQEISNLREGPWREIIIGLRDQSEQFSAKSIDFDSSKNYTSKDGIRDLITKRWPALWNRHQLPQEVINRTINYIFSEKQEHPISWTQFSGIPESALLEALITTNDNSTFIQAINLLYPILLKPTPKRLIDAIHDKRLNSGLSDVEIRKLPRSIQIELDENTIKQEQHQLIKQEQIDTIANIVSHRAIEKLSLSDLSDWSEKDDHEDILSAMNLMRKNFFVYAYRRNVAQKKQNNQNIDDNFWSLLRTCWEMPKPQYLPQLAQSARQIEGVFRICYITTLGRFEGEDLAALKLLDFIRSKDEDELRAVIQALAGIGTPRALLELVSTITRPNVTPALQLEICTFLAKSDVSNLQSEIRSAIKDLTDIGTTSASNQETREALSGLLSPVSDLRPVEARLSIPQTDTHLDTTLAAKIRHYKDLSSEVKRALRTSQFFHNQVSVDDAPESIDLSPVIDMQYKALELLFRECFEDHCSRLIQKGILQRKLDIIGYARPIPRAMDDFENYIGNLPTIREIPFFSKFKLRKTLRAICQFRPGKRFTLDGLKAFALFFLCFSRKQCQHGLDDLMPIGFKDDLKLFDFVKTLHIMQDFRNRAAHEGFHPDASNDMDGIWRNTSLIIQTAIDAKEYLDRIPTNEITKNTSIENSRPVVIERKKVS